MKDEAVIALLVVLVIASAGAGYYIGSSSERTTTSVSITTLTTTSTTNLHSSAATAVCYGSTLPTNTSGSGTQINRIVFNVTQAFDSWNWQSLSAFTVGSYTFVTTSPASTLEPQLFFNVTNSQGQSQRTSFTNLGRWNGQVWPPDMGLQATLFGGNVTIQWLFLCNEHSVFLEVMTQ